MTTASAVPPLDRTSWNGVAAGVFAGIAVAMQVGKIGVSLPLMRDEFATGISYLSIYAGLLSILAATMGLGFGTISRRLGPRRAVITGLLLAGTGSATAALATALPLLMFSRVLEACGFALVGTAGVGLIQSHTLPEDRSIALGLWAGWIPAGISLMMVLGFLALNHLGWRGMYWLCAAAPCAAAIWLATLPSSQAAPRPNAPRPSFRHILTRRNLLAAGIFFCFTAVNLIIMYYLPTLLVDRYGMTPAHAALVGFGSAAVQIPVNVLGSALLKKGMDARHIFLASTIGMTVTGLLVFSSGSGLTTCVAAGIGFSIAAAVTPAVVWSSVPNLAPTPADTPLVSGLIFQSAGLGQFFGPVLAAFAVDASGSWSSASWIVLILMAGSALCILRLRGFKQYPVGIAQFKLNPAYNLMEKRRKIRFNCSTRSIRVQPAARKPIMTGTSYTVRAATITDRGPISVLLRASYGWMLLDRYSADTVAGVLPELATPDTGLINSRQYYVATDDGGNLVGAGGWSWGNPVTGDLEHGKAHIRQFATHPTSFGKGVASAILARVRQDASAINTLECRSTVSAQGFFARQGFRASDEVLLRIAPHILMVTIRMTRDRARHQAGSPDPTGPGRIRCQELPCAVRMSSISSDRTSGTSVKIPFTPASIRPINSARSASPAVVQTGRP